MAKLKEIRVTFNEKELELYDFIMSKSSKAGFLKDLASFEKERQERILNSYADYKGLNEISIEKERVIEEPQNIELPTQKSLESNKSKVRGFGPK